MGKKRTPFFVKILYKDLYLIGVLYLMCEYVLTIESSILCELLKKRKIPSSILYSAWTIHLEGFGSRRGSFLARLSNTR